MGIDPKKFANETTIPGARAYIGNMVAESFVRNRESPGAGWALLGKAAVEAEKIQNNPIQWVANNVSWNNLSTADQQIEYLKKNNYDIKNLDQGQLNTYNLTKQILGQGLTGKWTGEGFGGAEANARAMAKTLAGAGITDIRQFGQLPDGSYGNKATGQPISTDYNRAGGQIFSGTYTGKDSTGFGVQFGPDGTPYFYTQQGASTSSMGDIVPVLSIGLALFAPGIGGAIGAAITGTAATTVASQVIGAAIVQGVLAEAQGGDFLDGAIKGAVTAGVAPAVANTVGTAVADVMADSAVKNVVANAVASSASSAVTAALTGGDVEQAAITGALAGGAGSVGREIGTAAELGTTPFSEQTQMLAGQEQGLGTAGGAGSQLGQALGAIGAGADPLQAILSGASRFGQEVSRATPTAGESGFMGPVVSAPLKEGDVFVPGAENVAQLISPGGVEVAGPISVVAALPYTSENLPKDFPVPEGYRVLSKDEMFASPREMRDAGIDVRYSDSVDGREAYIVPADVGKIRFENGQVFIDPAKPLEVVSGPSFPTDEALAAAGSRGQGDVFAPSTFVPEQVNILDAIAAGRGDVSQGQPITVAPTAPITPIPGVSEPVSGGQIDVSGAPVGTTPGAGGQTTPPSTQEILIPDQISQQLGGVSGGTDKSPFAGGFFGGTRPSSGGGGGGFGRTRGGEAETGGAGFFDVGQGSSAGAGTNFGTNFGFGRTPSASGGTSRSGFGVSSENLGGTGGVGTDTTTGGAGGVDTITGGGETDTVAVAGGGGADGGEITAQVPVSTPEIPAETFPEVPTSELPPTEPPLEPPPPEPPTEPPEEPPPPPEPPTTKPPYIRDFYLSGGTRKPFGPTVRTLGQALAPPLFPSAPVSGLTSYRGAGEIEGQQTGKPRRDVWNEASLRLKDALGL